MLCSSTLEEVFGHVFDDLREGARSSIPPHEYDRLKREFVFQMTDWQDDLREYLEFVAQPENYSRDAAARLIAGFLYHVAPHLNAAHRILLDEQPGDPFAPSA